MTRSARHRLKAARTRSAGGLRALAIATHPRSGPSQTHLPRGTAKEPTPLRPARRSAADTRAALPQTGYCPGAYAGTRDRSLAARLRIARKGTAGRSGSPGPTESLAEADPLLASTAAPPGPTRSSPSRTRYARPHPHIAPLLSPWRSRQTPHRPQGASVTIGRQAQRVR